VAQKTIVRLVDDLDDTEIQNGGGQTVSFGLDGRGYEIDLTNEHADELRELFSRYVSAGRKVGGGTARAPQAKPAAKNDYSTVAVREWAKSNNVEISARGRIPQSVLAQFRAAGN
jgi:hypothetical protein